MDSRCKGSGRDPWFLRFRRFYSIHTKLASLSEFYNIAGASRGSFGETVPALSKQLPEKALVDHLSVISAGARFRPIVMETPPAQT